MAGRLTPAAAVCLAAAAWAPAGFGQLADPTRPPAALQAPEAAAPAAAASGLQSVIMRKHGKPAALINGEVVELGGRLGEAKLIRITEETVVLHGPQGEETLRLTPAAEKKVGAGGTVKPAASGANKKGGGQ